MTVDVKRQLAVLDPSTGELIPIEVGVVTVAEATARLPIVQRTLRELRRFEAFLADTVKDDMVARGQTERRAGAVVYELKAEAEWIVDDEGALFRVLVDASANDEITRSELDEACAQLVTYRWHHGRLSTLAKRIPAINDHRRRVEGPARLKQK